MAITCQQDLDDLISCAKEVTKRPSPEWRIENRYLRNDALLKAQGSDLEFRIYMRRNADYMEFFSVGLLCKLPDMPGTLRLIRCNSKHGNHVNSLVDPHPHFRYHVHIARYDPISNGECPIREVDSAECPFSSYEGALWHLLMQANVPETDILRHFVVQRSLFEM